ncbi:protein-L-isoaspartate O-methyltransferase [Amylibacter sp. SFDW26]|uniref:protein-L-isoaspartate O-methyltransferase family protein n=1 Tax=Amylibacter sp. SFDW26 TaxID=2652722 RepID=UPI0012625E06|nr:protein-L-isoaspartate O-methyltransferase [Amylibacter sp. SFDW26]KAB7616191.1 protein-L-isoaspartate O-methyltransferase [Amylibacter sp. SFDW26]
MSDYKTARIAMVDCQVRPSDVTKYPIIDALLSTPREAYLPLAKRPVAYAGEHIALSADRVLLDARTFAKMLDAVYVQPTEMVLDIGCGLGYSTAVLAKMAEAVVSVESDAAMAEEANATLTEQSVDNGFVTTGDLSAGNAKNGPYDVIILQGAVTNIPAPLAEQLKDGGRICAIFQEGPLGACKIGYKSNGKISWRTAFNATAPLLNGFETKPEFTF